MSARGCLPPIVDPVLAAIILIGAVGLGLHLLFKRQREIRIKGEFENFASLQTKTLPDFEDALVSALEIGRGDVRTMLHTALHYGSPPKGYKLTPRKYAKRFRSVAVDCLGIRDYAGPVPDSWHRIEEDGSRDIRNDTLAYSDSIRGYIVGNGIWKWMQTREAEEAREAYSLCIASEHQQRARIHKLSSIARASIPDNPDVAESMARAIFTADVDSTNNGVVQLNSRVTSMMDLVAAFHTGRRKWIMRLNAQFARSILSNAGLSDTADNSILLKKVVREMMNACELPLPLTMLAYPDAPHADAPTAKWHERDCSAVQRLNEAVYGPWMLPVDDV